AFVAGTPDGKRQLWVRPLDSPDARALEGTDSAARPFWSPDSRSLGYFTGGKLYRVEASGGPPLEIVASADIGVWSRDGAVLTVNHSNSPGAHEITRVPASGGSPRSVMTLDSTIVTAQLLPDGKHLLFYGRPTNAETAGTYVVVLGSGEPKLVLSNDSNAIYAAPGYLLFVRAGTLMAQGFDASGLRLVGDAMPLAENVAVNGIAKRALVTASDNGTLVYEIATAHRNQTTWQDRSGKPIAGAGPSGALGTPSISPDGTKLALSISDPGTRKPEIWVYDLVRGINTRLTFSSAINADASWSPDGKSVIFISNRSGRFQLYGKAADGTGSAAPLVPDDADEFFPSCSADGRYLVYQRSVGTRTQGADGPVNGEIWATSLTGDRKPFPVVRNGQFVAIEPAISPDAHWLAYVSDQSGQQEVYIEPFLHGSGRWEVSSGGGSWPRWRRDGQELFYRAPDNKIVSVQIAAHGASLAIGKAGELFQRNLSPGALGPGYDVSADGKKFVGAFADPRQGFPPLTVVVNWPALLKKQ
ncbi:MAG: TolB family protein, partial [Terriglobales bacterium]